MNCTAACLSALPRKMLSPAFLKCLVSLSTPVYNNGFVVPAKAREVTISFFLQRVPSTRSVVASVHFLSTPFFATIHADMFGCLRMHIRVCASKYKRIHTYSSRVCRPALSPGCVYCDNSRSINAPLSSSPKPPLLVHCPVIYFSADRKPFDSADSLCSVGGPFEKSLYFFRVLFASGSKNPRLPQSVAKLVVTESSFSKKHSRLPPDS